MTGGRRTSHLFHRSNPPQRRILDPLAQAVLRGAFREGETVVVDNEGGQIVFRHAEGGRQQEEAPRAGAAASAAS